MKIVLCDFESVFIPEIWPNVALKTKIEELKRTTKDEPDYDKLMKRRLQILKENHLTLKDIQDVINTLDPLPGAKEFLDWLRATTQTIVVSDTYKEFAAPFLKKLDYPLLLCHDLTTDSKGTIISYNLRQADPKRRTVEACKSMNFEVIAFGDSYNDISMIKAADHGILFSAPVNVKKEFPQFPTAETYTELKALLTKLLK